MKDTTTVTTIFEDSFSEEVWASTYRDYKDTTIDDTFRRVAKAIASVEKTEELQKHWESEFFDLLKNFKAIPGGRILSNAGTEWGGTTLINCYVGPKATYDQDSLEGILTTLKNQAQTLKSEGGWGMNFSFIRPRGSFINGIGVETPGAVTYMELFDKSSEIITSGSGLDKKDKKGKNKIRKGAQMSVLSCWHPDIEEFINAKLTPGRLSKFNLSVDFSDEFMNKIIEVESLRFVNADSSEIEEKDKWNLEFPNPKHPKYKECWNGDITYWKSLGYPVDIHKTISATGLWVQVMKSTYTRNDPGVLYCDRANSTHCWNYGGNEAKISATNPCFHGDTLIAVADGRGCVSVKQLAEEGVDVPVYSYNQQSEEIEIKWGRDPRITGYNQEIIKVILDDDSELFVTPNHKFITMDGREVEAKDLIYGDSLPRYSRDTFQYNSKDKKSKTYWRIRTMSDGKYLPQMEHRSIAKFHDINKWNEMYNDSKKNGWVKGGIVIHHKDFNGLNNDPSNLEIMTYSDHSEYHAKLSYSGDKNPMYGKNHSEETKEKIGVKTKERCQDENYKNKLVNSLKNSMTDERNEKVSSARKKFELDRRIKEAIRTRLKPIIIDGELFVKKTCEATGKIFNIPWIHRTRAYDYSVNPMDIAILKQKAIENHKEYNIKRSKEILHNQIMIFKDLQDTHGKVEKKTFQKACKEKNISCRFNPNSDNPYIMPTFTEFTKQANQYNHRVKRIEHTNLIENVYNITVDDNHTVGIVTKHSERLQSGIFVRNCGEQFLPFSGCCDLGSFNLTQFINESKDNFDHEKLSYYIPIAVRFLDNINDYSSAPLPEYTESLHKRRRIGLGLMGWGSSLYLLKTRFASEKAEQIKEELMKLFTHTAVKASISLAKEKGMFESCDPEKHADHIFWNQIGLETETIEEIRKYGIRNSALFSIQPTGNTSILSNIVSGGLEPIFMTEYVRTVIVQETPKHIKNVTPKYWEGEFFETSMFKFVKEGEDKILKGVDEFGVVYKIDKNRGLTKEVLCEDYAVRHLKSIGEWDPKADWACTTTNLTAEEHIIDMKGFGKWLDSSFSKTINLPNDYPFESFKNIYLDVYKTGYLKGATTYRAGTMTNVLAAKNEQEEGIEFKTSPTIKRPKELKAKVFHPTVKGGKFYVAVGLLNDKPFEVFVGTNVDNHIPAKIDEAMIVKKSKGMYDLCAEDFCYPLNAHSDVNVDALTRMVSLALHSGSSLIRVVEQLERTNGDMFVFAKVLARTLKRFIPDGSVVTEECPSCGELLIRLEGCKRCTSCDYSVCG
jgi:ribonucleotide reductase alpha subunit